MKNRQRIDSAFVVLVLSASIISAVNFSQASSDVLSREDMNRYVRAFLDTYNRELEENFRPEVRKYFPFYSNYTYYVNATVSDDGAALEFMSSNVNSYEYGAINTPVESAIFKYVDLNITSLDNVTGYEVLIYTGPVSFAPFLTVKSNAHVFLSDVIVITNKASFVKVEEGGELFLSNVIVDERPFFALIMRGSNQLSAWTTEQAGNDAHRFLQTHLYQAFSKSEDFREYYAYPELSQLIEEIVWKHLHLEGYDLVAFKEDLQHIRDLAHDKYHVSTEFVDEIVEYIEKVMMTPSPPLPWYYLPPWSFIIGALVSLAFASFAGIIYRRFVSKKKTRTPRKKRKT